MIDTDDIQAVSGEIIQEQEARMKLQLHDKIMEAGYDADDPQVMDDFFGIAHGTCVLGEGDSWPPVFDKVLRMYREEHDSHLAAIGH
jgi:hypothetical protein|tara:strand:+ start:1263 stop:1523 length:261 start_codon:yes stop_codon:yes gene_type:complete